MAVGTASTLSYISLELCDLSSFFLKRENSRNHVYSYAITMVNVPGHQLGTIPLIETNSLFLIIILFLFLFLSSVCILYFPYSFDILVNSFFFFSYYYF